MSFCQEGYAVLLLLLIGVRLMQGEGKYTVYPKVVKAFINKVKPYQSYCHSARAVEHLST